MDIREYQINGYAFALIPPFWKPLMLEAAEKQFASLYFEANENVAYSEYLKRVAGGDGLILAAWQAFRQGVLDSGRIFIDDDSMQCTLLDTHQIARATGFNRSYIKSEIAEGRLAAQKIGREYRIQPEDYVRWYEKGKSRPGYY